MCYKIFCELKYLHYICIVKKINVKLKKNKEKL